MRSGSKFSRNPCWLLILGSVGVVASAPAARAANPIRLQVGGFVENRGQWHPSCRFQLSGGAESAFAEVGGVILSATTATNDKPFEVAAVRVRFSGLGGFANPIGERELPGRHNYFLGDDPNRWATDARWFGQLRYRDVSPGIDIVVGLMNGEIEYDVECAAGARLDELSISFEGVDDIRFESDGRLMLDCGRHRLTHSAPRAWAIASDGTRRTIPASIIRRPDGSFGFGCDAGDATLTIDPGLVWSTYYGFSQLAPNGWGLLLEDVVVESDQSVYLTGGVGYLDYPTSVGAFQKTFKGGNLDSFVTRMAPDGASLIWSTYLGGSAYDEGKALKVLEDGTVCVTGWTGSMDFPKTPTAYDKSLAFGDAFVTRLKADGTGLVFSSYLGGSSTEEVFAIDGDVSAGITVAGTVGYPQPGFPFPTTPGALSALHVESEGFVTRFKPDGTGLIFSTLLGSTGADGVGSMDVDPDGGVVVAGTTSSTTFPITPGAYKSSLTLPFMMFVSRLNPTGSALDWSTFVGDGKPYSLVRHAPTGKVYSSGHTKGNHPVTPGAFDVFCDVGFGCEDEFVTILNQDGTGVVASTFLGGGGSEERARMEVDSAGRPVVVGPTWSNSFPVTLGTFDASKGLSSADVFVTRFDQDLKRLLYSTYLGGWKMDGGNEVQVALDEDGDATVIGYTESDDFPVTEGAFQTDMLSLAPNFITRLDLLPTGATRYGKAASGSNGKPAIGVTQMPQADVTGFAVTCVSAPKRRNGFLLLAPAKASAPVYVGKAQIWVDPWSHAILPAQSDAVGYCEIPLVLRSTTSPPGARAFVQFVWPDPTTDGGIAASAAIEIVVQP